VHPETECIDYDALAQLAREHRPKAIIAGASAYPRTIDFPRIRQVCDEVGALFLVDMAHIAGLVAAGVHPNPCLTADVVTSTTHKTLRGPRSGLILSRAAYAEAIDKTVFPGQQGGPMMHVIAAKAVAFKEAQGEDFVAYQKQVVQNAQTLAAELEKRGIRVLTGGTDTHLMVIDLRPQGLSGRAMEAALDKVGITVSRSTVPNDPKPPRVTSGVRVGTPAVTTRGFGAGEMEAVAQVISDVLLHPEDEAVLARVAGQVRDLCSGFPVPGIAAAPPRPA
jgi:glycine hydroxymethyltransferase